jgi:hypothetical protein
MEAQDNLLLAKINQAAQANTKNRRKELKAGDSTRAAKFLARWIGPFLVTRAHLETSTYTWICQTIQESSWCFIALN